MKIGIVGLGVIGGSYALNLKPYGHEIVGYDTNPDTIKYAREQNIIDHGDHEQPDILGTCDVVFVCLYPQDTVQFIKRHASLFKSNSIVCDVSGVKEDVMLSLDNLYVEYFELVFAHPIAGREVRGIKGAKKGLFNNMNFIITPHKKNTPGALKTIEDLALEMGFGHISFMSDAEHDQAIGYTSQLTHAIAMALMNASDYNDQTKFTIGDSYRDLTRIARINEDLWSELFIKNAYKLTHIIDHFIDSLNQVKTAIKEKDEDTLKSLMIESTKRRNALDE
jgi:prephenate dehydrogenase